MKENNYGMNDLKAIAVNILNNYYNLSDVLVLLVKENRITAGALKMYSPNENISVRKLEREMSKYRIKKRVSDIIELVEEVNNEYKKALSFVKQQSDLPFEETQKQVAIKEGKIFTKKTMYLSMLKNANMLGIDVKRKKRQ